MSGAVTGGRDVSRKLVALLRLPVREQLTMARALLTVAAVEVGVRAMPLPRLAAHLGVRLDRGGVRQEPSPAAPLVLSPAERRQLRAVRRVMRSWLLAPGPCLRESLVLGHFWRRRDPLLRIGIAKLDTGRGSDLGAHAWLVVDGVPVGAQTRFQALRWGPRSPA